MEADRGPGGGSVLRRSDGLFGQFDKGFGRLKIGGRRRRLFAERTGRRRIHSRSHDGFSPTGCDNCADLGDLRRGALSRLAKE
jgi:hypothetical protein